MNHELTKRRLKLFRQQFGEMSYNELIELAEYSERIVADLPVTDPAWKRFTQERVVYFKYAEALNDAENLEQQRHKFSRKVLVSFRKGQMTFEFMVWVPRWEQEKYLLPRHWSHYTHDQLRQMGYSLTDLQDLEVVLM